MLKSNLLKSELGIPQILYTYLIPGVLIGKYQNVSKIYIVENVFLQNETLLSPLNNRDIFCSETSVVVHVHVARSN